MLHKSLKYKIQMFHNLEPPCCVKWPTNLTFSPYVSLQAGRAGVWCRKKNKNKNYGGTWHIPSPWLFCLWLLTAYILEIFVKHDSRQDCRFTGIHFDILSLFFFFSFLAALPHTEFPGQGSYPSHSSDLCHSYNNSGSLVHCAGLGIQPLSQLSRDTSDPTAPQRDLLSQLFAFTSHSISICIPLVEARHKQEKM